MVPSMLDNYPAVVDQLDRELVGWLTTVNPNLQPQSSPIWYLRVANDLMVYSRADATRITNLATNTSVAFNLRGDKQGDTIVSLEGVAVIESDSPTPLHVPEYLAKYGDEIVRLGWTNETFDRDFPVPIRIEVKRVRNG